MTWLLLCRMQLCQSICNVLSRCFLHSQKLVILSEPVKDKEHDGWSRIVVRRIRNMMGGAEIVVRKTLICSPELTCTTSKNTSVAGISI